MIYYTYNGEGKHTATTVKRLYKAETNKSINHNDHEALVAVKQIRAYVAPISEPYPPADPKETLRRAFRVTDQLLAEIENHAKEDALLGGKPLEERPVDRYTPWLEAKAAIRAAIPIPTE